MFLAACIECSLARRIVLRSSLLLISFPVHLWRHWLVPALDAMRFGVQISMSYRALFESWRERTPAMPELIMTAREALAIGAGTP